jgi:hypothetical protein
MLYSEPKTNIAEERLIRVRILGTGAANPTKEIGQGVTVTRTSEGLYRFSFNENPGTFVGIGGYIFGALGRLPVVGDRVTAGGAVFTVREMDGRRIDTLAADLHSAGDRRAEKRSPEATA